MLSWVRGMRRFCSYQVFLRFSGLDGKSESLPAPFIEIYRVYLVQEGSAVRRGSEELVLTYYYPQRKSDFIKALKTRNVPPKVIRQIVKIVEANTIFR